MGIRAAAVARKKTLPPRVPIATVLVRETAGAVRRLYPGIRDLHLVGSRLRHKYARDLDWVAVVSRPGDMPGRNVTLKIGALSVNLFFALPEERETTVLEFGLGLDIRRWKRRAIDRGFKLNRYGLFHKGVKMTGRLVEIAGVLGLAPKPALVWTLKNPF